MIAAGKKRVAYAVNQAMNLSFRDSPKCKYLATPSRLPFDFESFSLSSQPGQLTLCAFQPGARRPHPAVELRLEQQASSLGEFYRVALIDHRCDPCRLENLRLRVIDLTPTQLELQWRANDLSCRARQTLDLLYRDLAQAMALPRGASSSDNPVIALLGLIALVDQTAF